VDYDLLQPGRAHSPGLRQAHDKNRTCGMPNDAFRGAAEENVLQSRVAVGRCHDEVGPKLFCEFFHLIERAPAFDVTTCF
jgi:hypothetical protein